MRSNSQTGAEFAWLATWRDAISNALADFCAALRSLARSILAACQRAGAFFLETAPDRLVPPLAIFLPPARHFPRSGQLFDGQAFEFPDSPGTGISASRGATSLVFEFLRPAGSTWGVRIL